MIRAALPADAAAIAQIHIDTWRTTYRGLVPDAYLAGLSYQERTDAWACMLNEPRPHGCVYVAEEAGSVVGFADGGPERSGDLVYGGELYAIYILRAQQGKGAGRLLTSAVAASLAQAGYDALLLWVLARNPAQGFYERLGGRRLRSQQIRIGAATLEEIAYGWPDIRTLFEQGTVAHHEQ